MCFFWFLLKVSLRLYPCFLLANLLSWSAWSFFKMSISEILSTLTMSNTWIWNTFVPTPAVPTWFVSTLMAFYLLYPLLLPVLQGYSSEMLQILTVLMYQIQFLPYLLIKNISPNLNTILYIHPVFKMSVFIMGISAGILTLRGVEYPYCKQGYLHFLFPWKISVPGQERDSEFSTDSSNTMLA